MKKCISIESLLRWAIRDELPKGHAVSAPVSALIESAWTSIESYSQLGTKVDVSRRAGGGDGLGFVHGEAHPDAHAVAEEIAKLPAAIILGESRMIELLAEFAHRDEAGCYQVLDLDGVRAVAVAPFSPRALVIRCAVLGQALPFDLGTPQLKPVMTLDTALGRPRRVVMALDQFGELEMINSDRSGRYTHAISRAPRSMLKWDDPSVRSVAEARAEYTAWRDALVMLNTAIRARHLIEHALLETVVTPAEPWRTGVPAAAPVLRDGVAVSPAALPLKPARKRALRPHESDAEREDREHRIRSAAEKRRRKALDATVTTRGI